MHRPVVLITSNNEKELPDAFLRRCVFHYIEFPDEEMMERIVRVHHPNLDGRLLDRAIRPSTGCASARAAEEAHHQRADRLGDNTQLNQLQQVDAGNFDDQFNVDLQHNLMDSLVCQVVGRHERFAVLRDAGPRGLSTSTTRFSGHDEGYHTLDAIGQAQTGANDKPTVDVTMQTVATFEDAENAVLMVKAPEGYTGQSDITVTVRDGAGNTSKQTFHVQAGRTRPPTAGPTAARPWPMSPPSARPATRPCRSSCRRRTSRAMR